MESTPKPQGRGHRKTRKKGARSNFCTRKNDEHLRQKANKENREASKPSAKPTEDDSTVSLPSGWQRMSTAENTQYFKVEISPSAQCEVTRSVVVYPDHTWSVYAHGKKVPSDSHLLCRFSSPLSNTTDRVRLIEEVDKATLCPGNPEEKFIAIGQLRGGEIKGARGSGATVAFIDSTQVTDSTGQHYSRTIRRVDCEVICERSGKYPTRCKACQTCRSTLRSSVSRQNAVSDDHTSADSHTPYCSLTPAEKDQRLKHLHQSLRTIKQKVKRLEAKVTELIKTQALSLHECDSTNISTIVAEVNPLVEEQFAADSPHRIFWEQQKTFNSLTDKRQMRWHPLVVRFALNLKYTSSSAYRAVRQSDVISLPSERTLSDSHPLDYGTQWCTVRVC